MTCHTTPMTSASAPAKSWIVPVSEKTAGRVMPRMPATTTAILMTETMMLAGTGVGEDGTVGSAGDGIDMGGFLCDRAVSVTRAGSEALPHHTAASRTGTARKRRTELGKLG